MSGNDVRLKPRWGSVPSRYYAAWQRELFAFHLWPEARAKLFVISVACMERLMKITDVDEVAFGFGDSKESTNFEFKLNLFKAVLEKDDILNSSWVDIYRELWGRVSEAMLISAEEAFGVITNVLLRSLPVSAKNKYNVSLPGIDISWETQNLTASDILEKINNLNKNNSAEEQ